MPSLSFAFVILRKLLCKSFVSTSLLKSINVWSDGKNTGKSATVFIFNNHTPVPVCLQITRCLNYRTPCLYSTGMQTSADTKQLHLHFTQTFY